MEWCALVGGLLLCLVSRLMPPHDGVFWWLDRLMEISSLYYLYIAWIWAKGN